MYKYQNKNYKSGFSLVETVIVLAISAGLIAMVAGIYSQRRNVASDDAINQLYSNVNTVRNEAQKGLGPTNGATFNSGETLFGEAIEFSNGAGCSNSLPCLLVHKLKQGVDSNGNPNGNLIVYETYQMSSAQTLEMYNPSTSPCSGFRSCFGTSPWGGRWLVFANGSGNISALDTSNSTCRVGLAYLASCLNSSPSQLAFVYRQNPSGDINDLSTVSTSDNRYLMTIDMANNNFSTSRQ